MICQKNSYLREYEVDVTHVDYKIDKLPNVRLSISDQVFYPEGGGQPGDKGSLYYKDFVFDVLDTQEDNRHVYLDLRSQCGAIRKD